MVYPHNRSRDTAWILSWWLQNQASGDFGTTALGKSGEMQQVDGCRALLQRVVAHLSSSKCDHFLLCKGSQGFVHLSINDLESRSSPHDYLRVAGT
jgi:hypothetical protein